MIAIYTLAKALELAKQFTAPRKKKIHDETSPFIRGAWIDKEYVWSTDSTILIRIKHDQEVIAPFLHGYKAEDEEFFQKGEVKYPPIDKIIPDICYAKNEINITNLKEWQSAHELACVFKSGNNFTTFNTETKSINSSPYHKELFGGTCNFKYVDLPMPDVKEHMKISYNAEYMLRVLKALKKLKLTEATMYLWDNRRPITIVAEGVTFLVLPLIQHSSGIKTKPTKGKKPKKKTG